MTEKELKRLSRADLLELLLRERRENEQLHTEVESLKEQLAEKTINIENAGSIAEASLQLNGVFDAAQRAAEQYLENIRRLSDNQEDLYAQREARTAERCRALEEDTRRRCEAMVKKANEETFACWNKVSKDLDEFYQMHSELREMMLSDPPDEE